MTRAKKPGKKLERTAGRIEATAKRALPIEREKAKRRTAQLVEWEALPPMRFESAGEALEFAADRVRRILALAALGRGYFEDQPPFPDEVRHAAQCAAYDLANLLELLASGHDGPIECGDPPNEWSVLFVARLAAIEQYEDVVDAEDCARVDATVEPMLATLRAVERKLLDDVRPCEPEARA